MSGRLAAKSIVDAVCPITRQLIYRNYRGDVSSAEWGEVMYETQLEYSVITLVILDVVARLSGLGGVRAHDVVVHDGRAAEQRETARTA